MRLIDADKLKIPSEEIIAKMAIAHAPSIDIVRCKECMFADLDEEAEMYRCCSVSFPYWNKGEHFCSDGERKEQ